MGHRCKKRELRVFVVHYDEHAEEDTEMMIPEDELKEEEKGKAVEYVAFNSIVGLTTPGTMKFKGKIQEREVIVLFDCGATHNFISTKLADELQMVRTKTPSYGVIMGSRTAIRGGGICKGVVLALPEMTIMEDFLPLELGGLDVVLGMQWLRRVGRIQVDWPALTMTFEKDG